MLTRRVLSVSFSRHLHHSPARGQETSFFLFLTTTSAHSIRDATLKNRKSECDWAVPVLSVKSRLARRDATSPKHRLQHSCIMTALLTTVPAELHVMPKNMAIHMNKCQRNKRGIYCDHSKQLSQNVPISLTPNNSLSHSTEDPEQPLPNFYEYSTSQDA